MLELRSAVRKRVEKRAREMAPARRLRFDWPSQRLTVRSKAAQRACSMQAAVRVS